MSTRTATEWHQRLQAKEVSPAEIYAFYHQRTQVLEPQVQSFLRVFDQPSSFTDSNWAIPLGIKDNICLQGQLTTCGSKILENFIPPYDATVVQRLKASSVPILGKTNLDEFAMGSSCEHSAFQTTHNPWDLSRVPGGSSGGSASAVAAGQVPWSLGSDTGGSVRLPASFCNLVAMKPTYGCVSRYGLVAYASSLDQIGPMTLTVEDNAHLLQLIAGHDPLDSTSMPQTLPDFTAQLQQPIRGFKIGLPREMMGEGLQPEVRRAVEVALQHYQSLGAELIEVSLPTLPYALAAYYLIATSEASSNLARFDGVRYGYRAPDAQSLQEMYIRTRTEGFGDEVKLRIMLGTFALSSGYYDAYYQQAQKLRARLIRELRQVFEQCDVLLSAAAPSTAFALGDYTQDPLQMYLLDIMTVPANLAGIPALVFPGGFDQADLPIGLQLMGPAFSESRLYQLAYAYQQTTEWHLRRSPLEQSL